MGGLLRQLKPDQIREAFRAGGYTPEETEAFSLILQTRIAELDEI
jgi:hypothetical protein